MVGTTRHRASHDSHVCARRTIAGGVKDSVSLAATPWPLGSGRAAGVQMWDIDDNESLDIAIMADTHTFCHPPTSVATRDGV
jgi:hypothetical protein